MIKNPQTLKCQGVVLFIGIGSLSMILTYQSLKFCLERICTIALIQVHRELTLFLCLSLMVSDTPPPTVSSVSQ